MIGRRLALNGAGAAAGLVLVALFAEGWARNKAEFRGSHKQRWDHPRAGRIYVPGSEVRHTNMLDFWTVSRVNRWGFLDRDRPGPSPGQPIPGPSCRVAVVGDSFVEAMEVPVSDKMQVRFEEMARERLPTLRVATAAYGRGGTGQISQLGFYDEFISKTAPHVVVLAFAHNDFDDNFISFQPAGNHVFVRARQTDDGTVELRHPMPSRERTPAPSPPPLVALASRIERVSYAFAMLRAKLWALSNPSPSPHRPCATMSREHFGDLPDPRSQPPSPQELSQPCGEAVRRTGLALDLWKAHALRDDFVLVILAVHVMGTSGDVRFETMSDLATAREIPVVDQHAHVLRRNGRIREAHWPHDYHWTPAGHQWAAEALLEWLQQNQDVCAPGAKGQ